MRDLFHSFFTNITLPQSLVSMIAYTIAQKNHCEYCSANNELTCRTLGIDEKTLAALVEDLGSVSPARIAAIIDFAVKVAKNPQGLVAEDYDRVRDQGVTEAEIIEIIFIAAFGYMNDIVAESLKVDVDTMTAEALGR
jgi:alkylhydroperoxidase family enzyme